MATGTNELSYDQPSTVKVKELSYDKIFKTRDYDKFHILECNRSIAFVHLKRLMEAIKRDNQLKLHPIIVTSDYEVIDGQHRLEAARRLGLSIYYIVSDDVTKQHIIECNANQKAFELNDFIRFSIQETKNADYVHLQDLLMDTGLKVKAMLNLLFVKTPNDMIHKLKTGDFKLPPEEDVTYLVTNYIQFRNYMATKNVTPQSMFIYYKFTRAFHWLLMNPNFDKTLFYKKLDMRWHTIKTCSTAQEYYKLLVDIYNWKNTLRPLDPNDIN